MTNTGNDSGIENLDEGGHMTLMEHLAELRNRLIKSAVAVAVGAVVCWILYPFILDFLLQPWCRTLPEVDRQRFDELFGPTGECKLIVTSPLEPFSVRITLVGYSGLALAMPVLLWQGWRFIAPGLYRHEKRYAIPFVAGGALLFFSGVALAYWSLPRALDFLKDIGGPDLVPLFTPKEYLGFVVKMMVAFGVAFQFPIVLIGLQAMGVVENRTLRRVRSYAVVGIVILVAVITPSGDPFTLMALSIPMYAFYEMAILWGVLTRRRQRKREAARR